MIDRTTQPNFETRIISSDMSNISRRFITLVLLPIITLLALAGCGPSSETPDQGKKEGEAHAGAGGGTEGAASHEEESEGEHAGEIRMTPPMLKEAGIIVEPVAMHAVAAMISAPGRVVPTQSGMAHVGTVIPGRIARILVSEGAFVNAGAPLAEIEAFDVGRLQGEYLTARAELDRARSALARQEKLAGEEAGIGRALEEAKAAHAQAVAALRADEAKLRAIGIEPSSLADGGPFSSRILLRSPIAGVVSRRSVALGEYLEPNRDAFEVVNTGRVWIEAQLAPDLASAVRVGDAGFARERGGHRYSGRVCFVGPTVDPASRTVTVRIEVGNPDALLRPESFVTAELERAAGVSALAVPRGAVEQEGSSSFVYREHEPNAFHRVPVQTGGLSGDQLVITAGLHEGDRVAVSGLFYLKSARQKDVLEEHDD